MSTRLSGRHSSSAPVNGGTSAVIFHLFKALGLVVNQKKSILTPHKILEFLGFQVDTINLQLIFPVEKLKKIQQLPQQLLYQSSVLVRDLAKFVGKTSASTRAIWQTLLHFRTLQFLVNTLSFHGDRENYQKVQQH